MIWAMRRTSQHLESLRNDLTEVLRAQDLKAGKQLLESINDLHFQLTKLYQFMGLIRDFDTHFNSYHWVDKIEARHLVNQGQDLIAQGAEVEELSEIAFKLFALLPENERSEIDDSLLAG